jgi:hypothetical protein
MFVMRGTIIVFFLLKVDFSMKNFTEEHFNGKILPINSFVGQVGNSNKNGGEAS